MSKTTKRDPLILAAQFGDAVRFLTRLPVPEVGLEHDGPAQAAWAFPVVGALVGLIGGAVLLVATAIGVPALVAATLAVAATVLVTGALHEDGLADTFDGFGGRSPEQRLAIMRDSHIGTFGVAALVLTLAGRIAALATVADGSVFTASLVLITAEAFSRAPMVAIWHFAKPARSDGLASSGTPHKSDVRLAGGIAAAFVFLATPTLGLLVALAASVFAILATYILMQLSARTLGGITGDTLGGSQQLALAAFLVGASIG